jgi:hypothetical protein
MESEAAMPSISHQGLVELFRSKPRLAVDLVRDALHHAVPEAAAVEVTSASVDELVPTEHRADLMVILRDGERVLGVVIVEVQLAVDTDKPYTWPLYVYATRNRYRCPSWLLVVAPDAGVAAWAAEAIASAPGHPAWWPLVLGPAETPWVTTAEEAARSPELALLSAMAHGGDERAAALVNALPSALMKVPREMLPGFLAMLYKTLAPALRRQLERLMTTAFADLELPPFVQKFIDVGLVQGKAEGRVEGKAIGRAEDIVALLEIRGIAVPASVRAQVMACTDLPTLDHWFRRAAKLKTAAAVVRSRPKP